MTVDEVVAKVARKGDDINQLRRAAELAVADAEKRYTALLTAAKEYTTDISGAIMHVQDGCKCSLCRLVAAIDAAERSAT